MIVRDEKDVILRALKSALPLVKCYAIHDTGSNDGTPLIIKEFFDSHGISGEVTQTNFENFSENRNRALKDGIKKAKEHGAEYILLMDADMVLVAPSDLQLDGMSAYTIFQENGRNIYSNVRILKTTSESMYVGSTHEYLKTSGSVGKIPKSVAYFRDHNDGGHKQNKFTRDRVLLEKETKMNPAVPRPFFYLGNTYRNMGEHKRAVNAYSKYIRISDFKEEKFMALYYKAQSEMDMGEVASSVSTFLQAFEERPWRAEPLAALATHYRKSKQYNLAAFFADRGLKIKFPERDVLFVDKSVYNYRFVYELSICCYYINRMSDGLDFCQQLLALNDVPQGVRKSADDNMKFYT